DPTVLFTTAGMHPLVPYLLGEPHPEGKRLADAQKCIRTGDIDEVGDNRHLTFFEMLGNWSLGDYFKKEAIAWSFEFLTDKKWLGIDPKNLAVTVFAGDDSTPRDDESAGIWKSYGVPEERIAYLGKDDNWWPAGGKHPGPQGPDTEMFYWTGDGAAPAAFDPKDGRWVEIWNDVFMQFNKGADGVLTPLANKNVDTGMGLERLTLVLQGKKTVFDTELFIPILRVIEHRSGKKYGESEEITRWMRIIADHVKAATFIIGDPRGVGPSNVDQGYIVRRLMRRAIRFGHQLGMSGFFTADIAEAVVAMYKDVYPELAQNKDRITSTMTAEEDKFSKTLQRGLQEATKMKDEFAAAQEIPGLRAFYLYESFGFPMELTEEVLGKKVNVAEWDAESKKHSDLSRIGAEQKFAGGLADHSERVVRMHTATHLLHQALRNVLGPHVEQRGSNITQERLRFDFSHGAKMTSEQVKKAEDMVNEQIAKDYPVHFEMLTVDEAKKTGAIGLFDDKYAMLGNKVKVYMVGDDKHGYFSKEICGGPHVEHTALVGKFKILKEEASSAGIRRIKASIE
ncbi:alanine--tRNA ligase, partial [Candidatus Uhrbacteria bacterium]|nr:alanine--tRNA ligase [Candidatus Uhrbacteria bacterium]